MVEESRLVIRNLFKSYRDRKGQRLEAVQGVSFDVHAGECFGLLGPNGAGKSSIISCATGFFPATSGQVLIEGHDVAVAPKLARAHLGVCPQEDTLDTDFSIFDQMLLHASFFSIPSKEAKLRTEKLLKQFNLFDRKDSPTESLSGGMRRRLQVARALISSPTVLVLDEPTTGLDPDARRELWDAIVQYRSAGAAILLSTHYMDEAQRLCDRIAVLFQGKILDIDAPQALITKYQGDSEVTEEIRPGVFWKRPSNLEDVYLKLTGKQLEDRR